MRGGQAATPLSPLSSGLRSEYTHVVLGERAREPLTARQYFAADETSTPHRSRTAGHSLVNGKKDKRAAKDKRLTSDFAFGEKGKESLRLRLTRGRASPVGRAYRPTVAGFARSTRSGFARGRAFGPTLAGSAGSNDHDSTNVQPGAKKKKLARRAFRTKKKRQNKKEARSGDNKGKRAAPTLAVPPPSSLALRGLTHHPPPGTPPIAKAKRRR